MKTYIVHPVVDNHIWITTKYKSGRKEVERIAFQIDCPGKWFDEEYEFTVEVTGFLKGDHTERYCRNGEEIGDTYTCTYGCPVNKDGYGICSRTMMMLYPLMEAVRSGGDLENLGGDSKYTKTVVCPDGCVMFRLTAKPL